MKKTTMLVPIFVILSIACSTFGLGGPTPTPTADRAATVEAISLQDTQTAEAAQATVEAEATRVAIEEATSQAAMIATQTEDRRIEIETATAEYEASATAQAQSLADLVQDFKDEGYINSTQGTYYQIAEFDESWAMINYFDAWLTGFSPTDFVVRADISWDSASDTANWFNSGCGFIFRSDRTDRSFYVVFLTLDGYVSLQQWSESGPRRLGASYYGRLDVPDGSAQMVLVVEDTTFYVFINGRLVHTRSDTKLDKGDLAYTLLSGTNAGFGTRCVFENVELWEMESD